MHLLKLTLVLLIIATVSSSYDYGEDGRIRVTYLESGEHLLTPSMYANAKELVFTISDDRVETRLVIRSKDLYYTITIGQVTTVSDGEGRTFLSNAYASHGPTVFVEFIMPDDEASELVIPTWAWLGAQLTVCIFLLACLGACCYEEGKRRGQKGRRAQNQDAVDDEAVMMP